MGCNLTVVNDTNTEIHATVFQQFRRFEINHDDWHVTGVTPRFKVEVFPKFGFEKKLTKVGESVVEPKKSSKYKGASPHSFWLTLTRPGMLHFTTKTIANEVEIPMNKFVVIKSDDTLAIEANAPAQDEPDAMSEASAAQDDILHRLRANHEIDEIPDFAVRLIVAYYSQHEQPDLGEIRQHIATFKSHVAEVTSGHDAFKSFSPDWLTEDNVDQLLKLIKIEQDDNFYKRIVEEIDQHKQECADMIKVLAQLDLKKPEITA